MCKKPYQEKKFSADVESVNFDIAYDTVQLINHFVAVETMDQTNVNSHARHVC